jgi:maltose phosphorylase
MCTFHTSCFIRQDGHGLYFYLRTSRLDLDDYNKEVEEGCHLYGCGRFWWNACETTLLIFSKIPKQWTSYSFKINFRIITVSITHFETTFFSGRKDLTLLLTENVTVSPNNQVAQN